MFIPAYVEKIIEPFAGNCDLLEFVPEEDKKNCVIECYDIDPQGDVKERDTLLDPPDYTNSFVITNPPYLARNKCDDKEYFDTYGVNDLYKCFLKNLLVNQPLGGIVIIPLNFWSSIRQIDIDLRAQFLSVYRIIRLNIFEEQVFDDTTYTVCSFQFENIDAFHQPNKEINIAIYPKKKQIKADLTKANNYMIGGEIYKLKQNPKYKITRLCNANKNEKNTNILAKCIDDNQNNRIGLSYVKDTEVYIDETTNSTARTYCTLVIVPQIPPEKQKKVVEEFNKYLEQQREKYNSLFLTNYRESKDISRKRISFDLVYSIVGYVLTLV
jgi:hypothetical protein